MTDHVEPKAKREPKLATFFITNASGDITRMVENASFSTAKKAAVELSNHHKEAFDVYEHRGQTNKSTAFDFVK